jgi:hypothetical protein
MSHESIYIYIYHAVLCVSSCDQCNVFVYIDRMFDSWTDSSCMHIGCSAHQFAAYIRCIELSNVQPEALCYNVSSTVAYVYFDSSVYECMSQYPDKLVVEYAIHAIILVTSVSTKHSAHGRTWIHNHTLQHCN